MREIEVPLETWELANKCELELTEILIFALKVLKSFCETQYKIDRHIE